MLKPNRHSNRKLLLGNSRRIHVTNSLIPSRFKFSKITCFSWFSFPLKENVNFHSKIEEALRINLNKKRCCHNSLWDKEKFPLKEWQPFYRETWNDISIFSCIFFSLPVYRKYEFCRCYLDWIDVTRIIVKKTFFFVGFCFPCNNKKEKRQRVKVEVAFLRESICQMS